MRTTKLLLLFMLLLTELVSAQFINEECMLENETMNLIAESSLSGSIDPQLLDGPPIVVPVYFWKVNNPDGTYGSTSNPLTLTQNDLLAAIADWNIYFNEWNIFFKYAGWSEFSTPSNLPKRQYVEVNGEYTCLTVLGEYDPDGYGHMERCQFMNFWGWASSNGYRDTTMMNVYVPWDSNFGGAAAGIGSNRLILKKSKLISLTAYHELAHCFGIRHTRSTNENVTRDPYLLDANGDPILDQNGNPIPNIDYNADIAGDKVIDTAANPGFSYGGTYPYIDGNCEYLSGTEQDSVNEFYVPSPDDVANLMSDAYPCIEKIFTTGQKIRMREVLMWGMFDNVRRDVSVLYEPYTGVYGAGSSLVNQPPTFQPGFDYEFRSCTCDNVDGLDCSTPSEFNVTNFQNNHTLVTSYSKFESNYGAITHPNHTSILIQQLDQYGVRRCFDNWQGAIGGSLTTFVDGVFNNNVIIQPQDSLQINNENLINELPEGLHKIDKNYLDGSTKQNVVLKENE